MTFINLAEPPVAIKSIKDIYTEIPIDMRRERYDRCAVGFEPTWPMSQSNAPNHMANTNRLHADMVAVNSVATFSSKIEDN